MLFHLGLNLNQMFLQRLGILSLIEMKTEVIGRERLLTYFSKNLFTKSSQTNGIGDDLLLMTNFVGLRGISIGKQLVYH